ncbi:SDR family oxidoreductase [Chitinophaga agrisoli]|uniref:SDR family oxidoreductase n=1 Tax=Chitinophaga agrisoli TaxID=2607653 RepID=A0A5B2VJL3_9BACT|nr:SDR family oxidoreductase [Chitinophaga agrisoli]KAA2239271.1 SDR family oxidoreductase [Chitinophaga agrisoli]
MANWHLKNKKAVVTGGSKGIGKAIVQELLELGASVLFTARQEPELAAAREAFSGKGFTAFTLAGDVNDPAHRHHIVEWVQQHWGGALDILVNNAGINVRKPSADYSEAEYRKVLDIDLVAPFELCRLLYGPLRQSGHGAIINISSVAGSLDAQTGAPYGMAKAGLLQLTRSLASEWAASGIRVNSVSPWFTETPLTAGLLANQEKLAVITGRTPMRRIARDEEVAAAVAFLAMDKASFITGQNLSVDGGATISIL